VIEEDGEDWGYVCLHSEIERNPAEYPDNVKYYLSIPPGLTVAQLIAERPSRDFLF